MRRRLARFVIITDSMLCIPFPRLARWVIVASFEPEGFYVLDQVVFMRHRNALRWIKYESKALEAGQYAARRITDGDLTA